MPFTSTSSRPLNQTGIVMYRVVGATLAIIGLWIMVLVNVQNDRRLVHEQALAKAQGYAAGFAENLQKSILQIDQLSLTLTQLHEAGVSSDTIQQVYQGILPDLPLHPLFLDENGMARHRRTGSEFAIDLSQAEFFRFHRDSPSRALRINEREQGIAAFDGQPIVRLTRRVNKSDGSFGGVVAITMLPHYMNAFSDDSSLSLHDFASVWLADGPMLTNRTRGWGNRIYQHYLRRPDLPGEHGARLDPADQFHDNGRHFIGWSRLKGYPLVALVAFTEKNVTAPLVTSEWLNYGGGALATLLVTLLAWSNALTAVRRERARQKIEQAEARYRHAVDSVRDAIFVFAPCPADIHAGEFCVEDCNAQGARLVRMSRDATVGRMLAELFPDQEAGLLRELLRAATRDGEAQHELTSTRDGHPAWYFNRAVRVDNSIALTLRDVTELKAREQQMQSMALSDPLTLLHNRLWLDEYLPTAMQLARAESRMLALLILDFDNFKLVNDALGHKFGDELLVAVSVALRHSLAPKHHVARVGGDSFAILSDRIGQAADVDALVSGVREVLATSPWPEQASELVRKVSIGVALFPNDADDAVGLMKAAEVAVHAAGQGGGGLTRYYERSMTERRELRLWVESALPQALQNGEMTLHYQPRISAHSGQLRSFEALVRWRHPQRGLLAPGWFIPVAEESGQIIQLGMWVIAEACAQLARWRAEGLPIVPVSVNVSAQQLKDSGCRQQIAACLQRHRLAPSMLSIELTESTMVGEDPVMLSELRELRAMGIELHIDDFGTGYSSLAQLQRVDVDALKVDQSFVRALGMRGPQLCEAVISIGKALGATVVAEGVETREQLALLSAVGCDEIQGFLVAPAVPAAQAAGMLAHPHLIDVGIAGDAHAASAAG